MQQLIVRTFQSNGALTLVKRRKPRSSASIEFRGISRKDVEAEYRDWRTAYRRRYRVTKKHKAKRLPAHQAPDQLRRARLPRKYSLLVEYAVLRTKRG